MNIYRFFPFFHKKNLVEDIPKIVLEDEIPKDIPEQPPIAEKPDHQHTFEIVIKTYSSPKLEIIDKNLSLNDKILEGMLFGLTTLLWRCEICGDTRKEILLGSDESQLEEILEKVKKLGTQTIQKDGETFLIGKWQPPQQPNTVPLR